MKFKELPLANTFIIEPEPLEDSRGFFVRLFCENELHQIGHSKKIVQINHSLTRQKGSLRGMHYQKPPKAEIKIVTCLSGSVFDVIIDLRNDSDTFLKWHGELLSAKNKRLLYIPERFAHGFQALEPNCELLYFHSEFYNPEFENGIHHADPTIGIQWPLKVTEVSARDTNFPLIKIDFKGI